MQIISLYNFQKGSGCRELVKLVNKISKGGSGRSLNNRWCREVVYTIFKGGSGCRELVNKISKGGSGRSHSSPLPTSLPKVDGTCYESFARGIEGEKNCENWQHAVWIYGRKEHKRCYHHSSSVAGKYLATEADVSDPPKVGHRDTLDWL